MSDNEGLAVGVLVVVTTAPPRLDAPATLTVHAAPLWDVLWMAAAFIVLESDRAKEPARLVLVDDSQFESSEASATRSSWCHPLRRHE